MTQAPLSAVAGDPADTVPVIWPSGCSAASTDAFVAPTVTVTGFAAAWVDWSLYHCGARPGPAQDVQALRVAEVDLIAARRQSRSTR